MIKQNELVPKRRFEGFTNEWEERNFEQEVELYSGLTYSPTEVRKKGTFVLRSSNVQHGEIVNADNVYVNSEVVNSSNVRKGDIIVVVRNGSRSLIGKHAQIKEEMNETVIGAFMTGIRSNKTNFINALLDTPNFKGEIDKNLGATINQITNSMFKNMSFFLPSAEEQQKIGNFFKHLDDMIALQQRKLDKTKALKSAYLAEMFPVEGERVPKRRFAGFTEEWKKFRLDDIAIYRRGSFPQPYGKEYWYDETDGQPFVQVVDVGKNFKLVDNTKQKISKLAQQYSVFVEEGKVLVTLQGSIGRVAITQYPSYVDRTILIFENYKLDVNKEYFAYVVQMLFEIEKLKAPGGTIKTITKEALSEFLIHLPDIKEQQKIGQFFKHLDEMIATHQQKLEKLKATKQAYLHEMFV